MLHATMHLCQVQQKLHAALIATVNRQLADAPRGQQQGTGSNTHCQVILATRSAPLLSAPPVWPFAPAGGGSQSIILMATDCRLPVAAK